MTLLKNNEIVLAHLPEKDDAEGIYNFALSLEGTGVYDSFKEALVGGAIRTLTEIRLELYFAAKIYEATQISEHVDVYILHYDELVQKIRAGEFA